MIEDSDGAIDSIFGFHECRFSLIHKSIARCAGYIRCTTLNDSMALVGDCRALDRGRTAHCYIAKTSNLGQSVILQF